MIKQINIEKEFSARLVYRDKYQGDGKFNAIEFRNKFLKELENNDWWEDNTNRLEFDFSGVKTLSPSWANEAFAYYCRNYKPNEIKRKLIFINISEVKKDIIDIEIETGYTKK